MLHEHLKTIRKSRHMTLEELARRIGTSKQTVQRYESGVITNVPQDKIEAMAEALETTPAALLGWESEAALPAYSSVLPLRLRAVPMLGHIACGKPIYAEEDYGGFIALDGRVDADFCLRTEGDSMIGARIMDGDIVFIKQQQTVENGEIAAVAIGDEATLKRVYYYPESEKLILSPENPRYEPQVYIGRELASIKILGRAVAFQSMIR